MSSLRLRLRENFDRFNFANNKEKEMVDFRRWITAFAVLAFFVGLASAQVPGSGSSGGPLTCNATVAVPPQLRSESITDLIGDIVITCTGGNNSTIAAGGAIPTANITVSLATNITSRIINSGNNLSEALLLIDEPGTGTGVATGFGPGAAQSVCSVAGNPTILGAGPGGCQEFLGTSGGLPVATGTSGGTSAGPNMFFGVVTGNQVTFNGIPILAPVSSGTARVFRITNIRANVSGLGGGGLAGTSPLQASISISGNTSLPINNPIVVAGFIQKSLSTAVRNPNNTGSLSSPGTVFAQCVSGSSSGGPLPGGVAILSYSELFGTAFKTRVAATTGYNAQGFGTSTTIGSQNIPGTIYNSESGFIVGGISVQTGTGGITTFATNPGLADFGTRLRAAFNNVPSGIRIFVSVTNVVANVTSGNTTNPVQAATPSTLTSYAVLVATSSAGEAAAEGSVVTPTSSITNVNALALAELPVVGGSAEAVWEVYSTNPAALETLNFAVFTQYSSSPSTNSPAPGTGTVAMSYAPISTVTTASSSAPIPRFVDTSTAGSVVNVSVCQTLLLFPFVTNQSGFDTGIAIAATATDPVGTAGQSGTCTLNWYDGTGKTPPTTTGNIASGGPVYTTLTSSVASGFQGYMFASCNFQFAHGTAVITDLGARQGFASYQALVINNGSQASRATTISSESANH
jgi:hypothetical protein